MDRTTQGPRSTAPEEIEVSVRGPVGDDLAGYARGRLQPVLEHLGTPVHRAHLHLDVATAPLRHRATEAHLEVVLDHETLHARASGPDPVRAVDGVHHHLAGQVEELRSRQAALRRHRG